MKVTDYMKPSEGCWFDFRDDLRVKIKPLTKKVAHRISKLCTTKKFKKGQYIKDVDEERLDNLLSRELVVDWKNFQDAKGKDIPCTPENVTVLLENWQEFNDFVNNVVVDYQEHLDQQEEQAEKN